MQMGYAVRRDAKAGGELTATGRYHGPVGHLAVIIPTYNERENLKAIVGRVRGSVPGADVVVVDDNSPDGTGELADKLAAGDPRIHVLHRPGKSGLGAAYIAGFRWALDQGYGAMAEMDADGSHQPEQLPSLLAALASADLVIGSRWVPGGEVFNWPKSREVLSRGANTYTRLMLGIRLRDATAGYRVYRHTTLRRIGLDEVESQGYCFQVDLTLRALRARLTVVEVPITFVERTRGASKMSRAIILEAFWRIGRWGIAARWQALRQALALRQAGNGGRHGHQASQADTARAPSVLLSLTTPDEEVAASDGARILADATASALVATGLDPGEDAVTTLHAPVAQAGQLQQLRTARPGLGLRAASACGTKPIGPEVNSKPGGGHGRGDNRKAPRRHFIKVRHPGLLLACAVIMLGVASTWYVLGSAAVNVLMLAIAGFNLAVSGMEARWRLFAWRTPDAAAKMAWPEPVNPASGTMSFSLIVPARDEADDIGATLQGLLRQAYLDYEIVVSLCDDDRPTIAAAQAIADVHPGRIKVVIRHYENPMKALQLNNALAVSRGDMVGVFDAEDDVAPGLLVHVKTLFEQTSADVVQGGVQLMNLGDRPSKWFQVHNVLEYFSWYTSRMGYQAKLGFVPLGGNTVFIRRALLEAAGGWPLSLTEDCALGVLLSTRFGAKVATAYSHQLVTREETPPTILNKKRGSLFWQRDRWVRGFIQELTSGTWQELPTLRQRIMAGYILATPISQAMSCVLLPVALATALILQMPIGLALLMFTPLIPFGLTVFSQVLGLREFSRNFKQKVSIWHYASVLFLTPAYQLILMAAAIMAAYKCANGDMTWYKTGRAGQHRPPAVSGADLRKGA